MWCFFLGGEETMDDWIAMGRSTFEKDIHPTFGFIVIYPDSHDASVTL